MDATTIEQVIQQLDREEAYFQRQLRENYFEKQNDAMFWISLRTDGSTHGRPEQTGDQAQTNPKLLTDVPSSLAAQHKARSEGVLLAKCRHQTRGHKSKQKGESCLTILLSRLSKLTQ